MIYRLSIRRDCDEHEGYELFSSITAAKRRRAELVRDGYERDNLEIDSAPTPKGKRQMISLLNFWASHPDNG
jgi:hypothetical protein